MNQKITMLIQFLSKPSLTAGYFFFGYLFIKKNYRPKGQPTSIQKTKMTNR
jgi:hypothetical protein